MAKKKVTEVDVSSAPKKKRKKSARQDGFEIMEGLA
tara:strand:+ start:127387 stop:127494 length:108 start_codon:yes stop_codon:yes gene_type:complete